MYRPCSHCEGKKYDEDYCPQICTYGEARKRITELETELERGKRERQGRWVDRYGGKYANQLYECSECKGKALYKYEVDVLGKENIVQALSAACPHCRAKMDGE